MSWNSQSTSDSGYRLFSFRGIPVFATSSYLFLLLLFAILTPPNDVFGRGYFLVFTICMTFTLLVHEFGHGLAARRYNLDAKVVLHSLGGLCFHEPPRNRWQDLVVTASGPGAGLLFALVVYIVSSILASAAPSVLMPGPEGATELANAVNEYGLFDTLNGLKGRTGVADILGTLLWQNIIWSIFNLLPIWPLDGGQLLRIGASRYLGSRASGLVHRAGILLAVVLLVYALSRRDFFLALIAGYLGWENLQPLQRVSGGAPRPSLANRGSKAKQAAIELARRMILEAELAMAGGDWREAARLMHQMRADAALDTTTSGRSFEILALAYTEMGDYEEALDYIDKAPFTPALQEARRRCEEALA